MLAAAYNMMGALAFREKQPAEAKKMYELAVATFPQFVIARQNLEGMKNPAPPKTPAKPAPISQTNSRRVLPQGKIRWSLMG